MTWPALTRPRAGRYCSQSLSLRGCTLRLRRSLRTAVDAVLHPSQHCTFGPRGHMQDHGYWLCKLARTGHRVSAAFRMSSRGHHVPRAAVVRSVIQRSMSSSRQATARADKRTGAGKVPAFTPAYTLDFLKPVRSSTTCRRCSFPGFGGVPMRCPSKGAGAVPCGACEGWGCRSLGFI